MSERIKEGEVAGTSFRVGDPYSWSEIYYLDSPTDYREYLPQNSTMAPVMLDSCPSSISKSFGILFLVFAIIFLTLGYFLHTMLDNL
jgi:hypothetical protein